MRVLVCGGRDFSDAALMCRVLRDTLKAGDTLIAGAARGADALAERFCPPGVTKEIYPADWQKYGKAAGPIRNQQMLDAKPDLVVAFPGGRGTADMVRRAEAAGVMVRRITGEKE